MDFEAFFKKLVKDVQIDLNDEFDKNFQRKAFFDRKWPETKWPVNKGSLMLRTGAGRKSIYSKIEGDNIVWRSPLEYMELHNEGGEITVTAQMKKFFWAMYYKANNASTGGAQQRQQKLTQEAVIWKSLALQKVGKKMKVPQRQFIGDHPVVNQRIEAIFYENMKELEPTITNMLKQK